MPDKLSAQEILRKLEAHGDDLRRFQVSQLGLFGSAARGQATASSDLDFVVEFERKSFDNYMDLKEFLERTFGRSVDLVIKDAIKPRLRQYILTETTYASGL